MNEEAIKRIEEMTLASNTRLEGLQIPTVVLAGGNEVHDLERFLANPVRQRVNYTTERLNDFCSYVKKEATENETAVFIEPDGSGALAIIDFGTAEKPMWKNHKANLRMKWTPEFRAIHEICRHPKDQRALIDFIEDWSHALTAEANSETLTLAEAVKAIRAVTISNIHEATSEVADFEAASSALSRISAKSKGGALPGKLVMGCKVYPHTKSIQVVCRVSIVTGSDKPMFSLRIVGLEKIEQEVAEEIELEIGMLLDKQARVYVGGLDR